MAIFDLKRMSEGKLLHLLFVFAEKFVQKRENGTSSLFIFPDIVQHYPWF